MPRAKRKRWAVWRIAHRSGAETIRVLREREQPNRTTTTTHVECMAIVTASSAAGAMARFNRGQTEEPKT